MTKAIDETKNINSDLPKEFVQKSLIRYAERLRSIHSDLGSNKHLNFGSPIEVLFISAMYEMANDYGDFYIAIGANSAAQNGGFVCIPPIGDYVFFVEPQRRIGSYRVDFVIGMLPESPTTRLVVECDGHDFHQKTKQQVAKDKKRDRDLLMMGYKVMRFTGSEIFQDALGCAETVFEFLIQKDMSVLDGED